MAASHQGKTVFLCHAGESKPFVRQLVDRLEKDGLTKDEIFFDERSLDPGDELDSIIKVIESPSLKLFVFVVSKYCFDSDRTWIRAEWEAALANNKQVFPIWLDDNNDDFKAFGNLVRKFSYKLRKLIAQKVNPQEISTSLPSLSKKICSLISGDHQPTQQSPLPSKDNVPVPRQSLLPDVLPAKLKLEFVQKSYNQLLDKADALFDKEIFMDEERFKKAEKLFDRYKATIESIIKGCFIFNLRFFQPCNVDEFYQDHFRLGPASLSAALTRLLVTDQMRAAAGGEELMVRVEVRYDDYIRVRRQLCMAGIQRATSVDKLLTPVQPRTERSLGSPNLEGLDLAMTAGVQNSGFTELLAYPTTRVIMHLANKFSTLEGRLETAKRHAENQESMVKSLQKKVTRLNEEYRQAQWVLERKTMEVHALQEMITEMEATTHGVAMTKMAIPSPEIYYAPRASIRGFVSGKELDTTLKGAEGEAQGELLYDTEEHFATFKSSRSVKPEGSYTGSTDTDTDSAISITRDRARLGSRSAFTGATDIEMKKSRGKRKLRNEGPHKCDVCPSCFSTEQGMLQHRRDKHERGKPHRCDVCPKTFSTIAGMQHHRVDMHGSSVPRFGEYYPTGP